MAFKRGMTVDVCMAYILMLVSMTFTLMQGHNGSADEKNLSVELSRHLSKCHNGRLFLFFYMTLTVTFKTNIYVLTILFYLAMPKGLTFGLCLYGLCL